MFAGSDPCGFRIHDGPEDRMVFRVDAGGEMFQRTDGLNFNRPPVEFPMKRGVPVRFRFVDEQFLSRFHRHNRDTPTGLPIFSV